MNKRTLLETKAGDMTQEFKILKTLIPEFSTTDEEGNEQVESVATEIEKKNWEKAWSLAQSVPVVDTLCRIEVHSKDEDSDLVGYILLKDKEGKPIKQISTQVYRDIFAELVDKNKVAQFFHNIKSNADNNAAAERATQTPFDKEEGQHSTGIGGDLRTLGARIKGAFKGMASDNRALTKLKTLPLNPDMFEVVDKWQDATVFEKPAAESLYKEIKKRFKDSEYKRGNELIVKDFESKESIKSCREWVVVEYLQDLNKTGPNVHDGERGGAEGHWGLDIAQKLDNGTINFLCTQVDEFGFGPELKMLFTLFVKLVNSEIYLKEIEWKRACNLFSNQGPYVLTDIYLPRTDIKTNIIYVKDLYKNNDYLDIASFYKGSLFNEHHSGYAIRGWLNRICKDNGLSSDSDEAMNLKWKVVRCFICADSNIQGFINYYTSGRANADISKARSKQRADQKKILSAASNQQTEKKPEPQPQQTTQSVKDVNPANLNPSVGQYVNDSYNKNINNTKLFTLNEANDEIVNSVDKLKGYGGALGFHTVTSKFRSWKDIQDLASQVVNIKDAQSKKEDDEIETRHNNSYNVDDKQALKNAQAKDPAFGDNVKMFKKDLKKDLEDKFKDVDLQKSVLKKVTQDIINNKEE